MKIDIRELSTGGGCGCKFPLSSLELMFKGLSSDVMGSREDVGTMDISSTNTKIVSSIDFIQPILGDEELYGRVAALHAMNDLFASGVKPKGALIVLCWPRELIGLNGAKRVMRGIEKTCAEEGVTILGGHSIDAQNPIVGLAVFGESRKTIIECNSVKVGDKLFLSKRLGVGIGCNAELKNLLDCTEVEELRSVISTSNRIGVELGKIDGVTAMTDVTGYGLRAELDKMTSSAGLRWRIRWESIGSLNSVCRMTLEELLDLETKLGKQNRKDTLQRETPPRYSSILAGDPQTNGPLLFSVDKNSIDEVSELFANEGTDLWAIGEVE
ncbi:selenide, water dikinase SelD [Luteolibacter sp. AS25]|uniref:selenide, water dikinase SelD n=1 Tax=Luteolibacter sp. AS25 TaxID=3135776 RepID=UPI00398B55C6